MTYVKGYKRDRAYQIVKDRKTAELRHDARLLNRIRVKAVSRRMSEPLDAFDIPESQKQRMRGVG